MHRSIESWIRQEVDHEWENSSDARKRQQESAWCKSSYFCHTGHRGCFGVEVPKENRIEKEKYQSDDNKDHIVENTGTVDSAYVRTRECEVRRSSRTANELLTSIVERLKSSAIAPDVGQRTHPGR